ncbi:hypothetical protein GALMADRAFT_1035030 [Galerina marginata CBS 339.88]|uniref:F-box domain-containing protein n=1 Tax=Galerina marginata (strain CBS 339.88) TaxID=685588 RepID=A0A067SEX0_GALM3|nr:hypothetical protein GALMADRAFT_1035030 [Galerina marginata CBS 339.88]
MKQRTYVFPHIHELFAFGVPELPLMALLCSAALPTFLPLLLATCVLLNYWLTNKHNSHSAVNVQATTSSTGAQIDIGGHQHNLDWAQRLQKSCAQALRTDVLHDVKNFQIDLRMHLRSGSGSAFDVLCKVLETVSSKEIGASRRHPGIELNVDIQKDDDGLGTVTNDSIVPTVGQNLDQLALGSLQKITWRGPRADFLFTQPPPPSRTLWDSILPKENEPMVTFSSLQELRLLDCVVEPRMLAEILIRCPVLTRLEVEHVGVGTTNARPMHDDTPFIQHLHLRHLKLSSTAPLEHFFNAVELFSLESLSLDLSPSAIHSRVEDDLSRLAIPWFTLRVFELRAPMDYASFRTFRLFSDREPSRWGRSHTLTDNRAWTRSRYH